MKTLFMILALAFVATLAKTQSFECYNPNTGEDCGQCYVAGKTCEAANGRCPNVTCQWCRKIVRTEFCGTFYLDGACWCFALEGAAKESCLNDKFEAEAFLIINKQKVTNAAAILKV